MGHHDRLRGTQVGADARPAVEAEPAEPQQDGAEHHVGDIVRPVRKLLSAIAMAPPEVNRDYQSGGAGADVHGRATGIVETAHLVRPAVVRVPGPARDRIVDDGAPAEDKQEDGSQSRTVRKGTAHDYGREHGKHHLVDAVDKLRDSSAARAVLHVDVYQAKVLEVSDKRAGRITERERETPEEPLERCDCHHGQRHPEHAERILPTQQAGVEKADTGDHDEHQAGRHEDPRNVAQVVNDRLPIAVDGRKVVVTREARVHHAGWTAGRAKVS